MVGTGILSPPVPGSGGDAHPSLPALPIGELRYRALDPHGGDCRAVARGLSRGGIEIDVYPPGTCRPLTLRGVTLHLGDPDTCPRGACFRAVASDSPAS